MRIVQDIKIKGEQFLNVEPFKKLKNPLLLVFGNRYMLEEDDIYKEIKKIVPSGHIVFGSTSGEILEDAVYNDSVVVTAIEFERSSFIIKCSNVYDYNNNDALLGEKLMEEFPTKDLKHVFVVSEGSIVNGSALINGFERKKGASAGLSGGLCGDDARFERTLASYNENPKEGEIIAIGFYGEALEITSANYGGWTPFGPERIITKSNNNVLYELDGKPALDLYKNYLGEKAKDLPESALLYPLSVKTKVDEEPIVRTILNINHHDNSMVLAGDVPEGSKVQLMMSSVDDIANGANKAAKLAMENRKTKPELSLLVSCIGRKLVMDQRTEEEIEEVKSVVGKDSFICGFYSYGEMAPFSENKTCRLHNQTMTLTLFSE
ncbi:FIST signal transduction protein [Croceitalea marina]|uniref:FIST signal transduction protein n=1 Tax=Croceitalea marina TaxID=1775166 RepID=A0ABW5MWG8_9FLAO